MQIPQLTITRFIASVMIVILHYGLFTWPFNHHYLSPFFGKGVAAVSYFFLLSGFILVISNSKEQALPEKIFCKKFWWRRFARIFPVYFLALLISFFLHFHYDPSIPLKWQIQSYIYSLFFLQTWKYQMALDVNYPSWSVSVEAFFYFIFPWLYWNIKQISTKGLAYVSIAFWLISLYFLTELKQLKAPENFYKFFPLLHLPTFIMGLAAGIGFVRHYTWLRQKGKRVIHGMTILASIFVLYTAFRHWGFYQFQHNGLLAPFFVLIIYSISLLEGRLKALLAIRPLQFLGNISYSLYIFQFPIWFVFTKHIPWFEGKEGHEVFWYYLPALLGVSMISYLLIEKPIRNFMIKRFPKKWFANETDTKLQGVKV